MRMSLQKRIGPSLRRFSISWWIVQKHPLCPWILPLRLHPSNHPTGLWPKVSRLNPLSNTFLAPCPLHKSPTTIKPHMACTWLRLLFWSVVNFINCVLSGICRVAFLLELALLALQVKHQKVAGDCLKELKSAGEAVSVWYSLKTSGSSKAP